MADQTRADALRKQLVREGNALLVKCYKIEIRFPEDYVLRNIAEIIEDRIRTFGLFEFFVWETSETKEPQKFTFRFPSVMMIHPSEILLTGKGDERFYTLTLFENDQFMTSVIVPQSGAVVKKFVQLLLAAYIPDDIPYNEIINLWDDCLAINEVDLKVGEKIPEFMIAEFCRDPKDYTKLFRHYIARNPGADMTLRKILTVEAIPRYGSAFAALTSADSKQGMMVSVIRKRKNVPNKVSPIEQAIT